MCSRPFSCQRPSQRGLPDVLLASVSISVNGLLLPLLLIDTLGALRTHLANFEDDRAYSVYRYRMQSSESITSIFTGRSGIRSPENDSPYGSRTARYLIT